MFYFSETSSFLVRRRKSSDVGQKLKWSNRDGYSSPYMTFNFKTSSLYYFLLCMFQSFVFSCLSFSRHNALVCCTAERRCISIFIAFLKRKTRLGNNFVCWDNAVQSFGLHVRFGFFVCGFSEHVFASDLTNNFSGNQQKRIFLTVMELWENTPRLIELSSKLMFFFL